ncbi:MAG: hypothetical protein H6725_12550 [Sandaracinaceae bacterium]|nr:hypothetical protein [Sandaracinaceae bacterium]
MTALAQQAVQQRIPGATLLNTAEDVAASSGDVRVCRTQLHSALGPDEWVRFSVSPHGDSQIFVQFMQ